MIASETSSFLQIFCVFKKINKNLISQELSFDRNASGMAAVDIRKC